MKVFICIRKITFDEKTAILKPVDVSVGTLPRLLTRSFPTKIKSPSLITCQGLWTCHPVPGHDDKFLISLVRGSKILASVVIPLSWLPQNQVVKTWFPMKFQNHKSWKHAPMALITLHFDTVGNNKFNAPKGNLMVIPGWKIPQKKKKLQQNAQAQPRGNFISQQFQPQMRPVFLPPQQQMPQPAFYNQHTQFPFQYASNPQNGNCQIPQQLPLQQPYQFHQMKGQYASHSSYNLPQQYVYANDDDIPKVNYPIIH